MSVPASRKTFPIMLGDKLDLRRRRGESLVLVRSIPWRMIDTEPCRVRAQANHGQDLETLAGRGGLSACEAVCVLAGMGWQPIGGDESCAHLILRAMCDLFGRDPSSETAS
jgi:hypothetical protein